MTKTLALLFSASLGAALAACTAQAEVRYAGNAGTPELVTMESNPSVLIVANSEEPVFYTENMYWLHRNHRWYRSTSHRDGWREADRVPDHVRRIQRPHAYVHVRPDGSSPTRTSFNQRDSALQRPVAREPERTFDQPAGAMPDRTQRLAPDTAPSSTPGARGGAPDSTPPATPDSTPDSTTPDPRDGTDRERAPEPVNPSGPTPERPEPPDRAEPTLRGPGHSPGGRPEPDGSPQSSHHVPAPSPDPDDRPSRQIAPDPDRAPVSPGQPARADDRRPAADPDDRPSEPASPDDGR